MTSIFKKFILTTLLALFASQASALFIQPDWFDPTEPGVGTNRYAYSLNDPVNRVDPNGNDSFLKNMASSLGIMSREDRHEYHSQEAANAQSALDQFRLDNAENSPVSPEGLARHEAGIQSRIDFHLRRADQSRAGVLLDGALLYGGAALGGMNPSTATVGPVRNAVNPTTTSVLLAPQVQLGNKLEFFFGNATGNVHNIQRSQTMASQLSGIGIYGDDAGRAILRGHLEQTGVSQTNIVRTQTDGRVVREALLMGPGGSVRMETVWQGAALITGKILSGAQ